MNTEFSKQNEYKEEIEPIVMTLVQKAAIHKIPIAFAAAVANSSNQTIYENEMISAEELGLTLEDNRFSNILIAANGGKFIPSEISGDFDDEQLEYIVNANPNEMD